MTTTMMVSASAAWIIVAAAMLAAGALTLIEWRRRDHRHRAACVAASLLAVGALGVLGVRPAWRHAAASVGQTGVEAAALWTAPGASGGAVPLAGVPNERRFALPGAGNVPPGVKPAPDVAFVRRQLPRLGTLHVLGDGLEPWDLATLSGVRIIFHPTPSGATGTAAAVGSLRVPREVPLGEALSVQGRVDFLTPGETATLTLLGPDGAVEGSVTTAPAGGDGTAAFAVAGAPTRAAGCFSWRLRLQAGGGNPAEEELGVAVVAPEVPRVLVLESAPRFDTAPLRHWLGEAGGAVTVRTVVGQDRSRFASTHGAPGEFAALDDPLLARFDVVLADGRALSSLAPAEGAALRAAVTDNGLGVLVLGDGAAVLMAPGGKKARGLDAVFFVPWELEKVGEGDGEDSRPVRPTWAGLSRPPTGNVSAEPFAIHAPESSTLPGARTLVRDGQGRALAVGVQRGRGQVAFTLVRETRRWRQGGEPEAFAAYWSFLLSEVARRREEGAGRWSLAGGAETGPAFVHQPVELRWTGAGTPAPGTVEAAVGGAGETAPLPLAQDPAEPSRWRGTFWPRQPGWHRVRDAAGTREMDFYVHPSNAWAALRAERRRAATARSAALAASSETKPGTEPPADRGGQSGEPVPWPPGWAFTVFFLAAGYLWAERRFAPPATA